MNINPTTFCGGVLLFDPKEKHTNDKN